MNAKKKMCTTSYNDLTKFKTKGSGAGPRDHPCPLVAPVGCGYCAGHPELAVFSL